VGIFSPSLPRLITTGAVVRRGTNGAVSLLGLLFSAAGGLLIGMVGWVFASFGHGAPSVRFESAFYHHFLPCYALQGIWSYNLRKASENRRSFSHEVTQVLHTHDQKPACFNKIFHAKWYTETGFGNMFTKANMCLILCLHQLHQ
jgi:hypothetical protein